MMNSKTQAQKNEERERRRAEQAAQRKQEKDAQLQVIQKQLQQKPNESRTTLSKKEQRKLKQHQSVSAESKELNVDEKPAEAKAPPPLIVIEIKEEPKSNHNEKQIPSADITAVALEVVKVESQENKDASRIVHNHSTHCPGLRPFLIRLQKCLIGCTITPGQLSTVANHANEFELRFQRAENGGFKFVARNGSTAQDVFITVQDKVENPEAMVCEAVERVLTEKSNITKDSKPERNDDISSSELNGAIALARNNLWREQHQKQVHEAKAKEKETKKDKKIKERMRTLAGKGIASGQLEDYAKRDESIVTGHERGKHSMGK